MKNLKKLLFQTVLFLMVSHAFAGNPIKNGFGMADPHCYIFNDKAYLFTTRDADKTAKKFVMPDWQIWSSEDLVEWKLERYIYPSETWMGESDRCWATETVTKNGKYYFYFSNGNTNTGVLLADQPQGPYRDILKKPMLDVDLSSTKEYDPTVLVDDDDKAYIMFGHHIQGDKALNWFIAKLNDDMVSLAEEPKEIILENVLDHMQANDKPNLHKHNGYYYLSAGSHYAISKSIYGPYSVKGNSGNGEYGLSSRAHGNYFTWNNQWFHTWCHFHLGKEVARYRESYMTYLHYTNDGKMVSDVDFLTAHFETGVGQYDAEWNCIQAEWYMKAEDIEKNECVLGGFQVVSIKDGASITFPNMTNLSEQKSIKLHVASTKDAVIEVRSGDCNGALLGKAFIKATKKNDFVLVTCELYDLSEVEDICFRFVGEEASIQLDYFSFR
ncbi:family 43 glycosylhydrolase [Labilibacter marinus]|uniref:family 43 glycosylhydrolase n=1 Tax=Labilibacter marinus TaxID=1477105 RepID=UPI0008322CDB|nr:family 43 glycosylhydrolase [Labilibacter marinus]